MHLIKPLWTLLITLSAAIFSAQGRAEQAAPVTSALDGQLFYDILLGELSVQADDPGTGFALMLDAARKAQDEALYRRAVQIALQTRSGKSALMAAKAWREDLPQSEEANRFVLQILLGMNQIQDAKEPYQRAVSMASEPARGETIWSLSALFEHASNKRLAAQTVRQALSDWLQDRLTGPSAWAAIGRLWLKAGDYAASLDALNRGQKLDLGAERPALVALALMDARQSAAEQLVQAHLPLARDAFRMAYVRTLLNLNRSDEAQQALQSLLTDHPQFAEARLVQGLLSISQGQWDAGRQQLQTYLQRVAALSPRAPDEETRRGQAQAYFGLAQVAEQTQDWRQADDWLKQVNDPDEVLRASIKRAELLARQEKLDQAIGLISQYRARNQGELRLKRSAQVQLLRDHGRQAQAIAMLKQALAQDPTDAGAMYELAMVHEQQGELVDMEHWLRQHIAHKPDDAQAYNALGYALADRNMRLDEAKALIEKAVNLSPDDPYIQDSLGWVEFRMGQHAVAIKLLRMAFDKRPDAEIAAHLGEALWTNQRRDEALEVFQKGWRLNPQNKTLQQTVQRLGVSL
jgi:tetratricopeptide (TPR) repeat protein